MTVKEVAQLAGVSVRTLHYYDQIGLLKPTNKSEARYRLYTDDNLQTLQQILFFRELDFPLKKIKEMMNRSTFDQLEALHLQRQLLIKKKGQVETMIAVIDRTIQQVKGEIIMTNEEKFAGFDFSENKYEKEARERWGDDAIDKANAKFENLSESERKTVEEEMNEIFRALASVKDQSPSSEIAQQHIAEWFDFLNETSGHDYSMEAFASLGEIYVHDDRFTKNIDQFGKGLAVFMSEAMKEFARK